MLLDFLVRVVSGALATVGGVLLLLLLHVIRQNHRLRQRVRRILAEFEPLLNGRLTAREVDEAMLKHDGLQNMAASLQGFVVAPQEQLQTLLHKIKKRCEATHKALAGPGLKEDGELADLVRQLQQYERSRFWLVEM